MPSRLRPLLPYGMMLPKTAANQLCVIIFELFHLVARLCQ